MQEISIEVFKTNISRKRTANKILRELKNLFPDSQINFDLYDRDNILRIEGIDFSVAQVMEAILDLGYRCEILE